jgi:hypothetical protein
MNRNYLPILTLIAVLVVASLACSLSIVNPAIIPTSTPTQTPILVTTQAAGDFINSLEQPTFDPTTGSVTIVLTEQEITSYVATQLQSDPNTFIRDPQVTLEDNQVIIHGTVVTEILTAPGTVSATITVGEDGLPVATITSATVGSFPIPSPLLSTASDMIDQGISKSVNEYTGANYQIVSITIADHQMTIVFKKK